nr:hypothetical protein [Tanacetum cinerariifolium]
SLTNSLDTRDYVKIRTTLLSGHPSHLYICINKLDGLLDRLPIARAVQKIMDTMDILMEEPTT